MIGDHCPSISASASLLRRSLPFLRIDPAPAEVTVLLAFVRAATAGAHSVRRFPLTPSFGRHSEDLDVVYKSRGGLSFATLAQVYCGLASPVMQRPEFMSQREIIDALEEELRVSGGSDRQ